METQQFDIQKYNEELRSSGKTDWRHDGNRMMVVEEVPPDTRSSAFVASLKSAERTPKSTKRVLYQNFAHSAGRPGTSERRQDPHSRDELVLEQEF